MCPKCHGLMSGPTYKVNGYGHERLVYVCTTCGYSDSTPTKDAKPSLVEKLEKAAAHAVKEET